MNIEHSVDVDELLTKYNQALEKIAELEAQVERMKCCGNCKEYTQSMSDGFHCSRIFTRIESKSPHHKCKLWEGR